MKAINWKCALYIVLVTAALTTIINWFASEQVWNPMFIVDSISISVIVISFASAFFCTFLWKMAIFRGWLVRIPNLNGNWIGRIESDWIDPKTTEKIAPIDTELIIRQSLFNISCVMKTGEMRSESISANIIIDADNQKYQLVYIYVSIPKQNIQVDSPIHYGTMMVDLEDNFKVDKIHGNYWTGRKTGGYISVEKK